MHLQVRSTVTSSSPSEGPGAMSSTDARTGITRTDPGRLLRLLELLAEDRSGDPADGHGPFNLTVAAGAGIELTGRFIFAVSAEDHDQERKEHELARQRILDEFPDTEIVERLHRDLPDHPGALHDFLKEISDRGRLVDEIVIGVARCAMNADGTDGSTVVPVQVSVVEAHTGL